MAKRKAVRRPANNRPGRHRRRKSQIIVGVARHAIADKSRSQTVKTLNDIAAGLQKLPGTILIATCLAPASPPASTPASRCRHRPVR